MTSDHSPTVPLPGSQRHPMPGARRLGVLDSQKTDTSIDPEQPFQVTVMLRRRTPAGMLHARLLQQATVPNMHLNTHLSEQEFDRLYGADPAEMEQVAAFAAAHGLEVVDREPTLRRLTLRGSAVTFGAAFGVTLETFVTPAGERTFRGRSGVVQVPAALADIIEGVFGLDDRPQARPHFRVQPAAAPGLLTRAATVAYTPPQLAAAYDFPTAGKGQGQCVAIIELGGGYRPAELEAYFSGLGLTPPKVVSKSVDGARNHPGGSADGADGEVLLDIEVVGAVAPAATIVVYFAPNTDAGFLNAISTAIHDRVHRPSVVSISWGGPESSWTAQAMRAMDAVFQDAAALGVTICCAAGDDGSSDQRAPAADDGRLHADFPASSPFVLACGGTRLQSAGAAATGTTGTAGATVRDESVWNQGRSGGATGGGISEFFPRPVWQDTVPVPLSANPGGHAGRGVPDVAANADPATGYLIHVDGQAMVIGGTSAVAPLYAALIALCNEQLGRRIGHLNPLLYRLPAGAAVVRDIRAGDNDISGRHGPYAAGAGWDACTGLGSLHGMNLLRALQAMDG